MSCFYDKKSKLYCPFRAGGRRNHKRLKNRSNCSLIMLNQDVTIVGRDLLFVMKNEQMQSKSPPYCWLAAVCDWLVPPLHPAFGHAQGQILSSTITTLAEI